MLSKPPRAGGQERKENAEIDAKKKETIRDLR
jgi:hypothetical protein